MYQTYKRQCAAIKRLAIINLTGGVLGEAKLALQDVLFLSTPNRRLHPETSLAGLAGLVYLRITKLLGLRRIAVVSGHLSMHMQIIKDVA
ncbi:MAG: hypothetical protein IPK65_08500 [Gammaproteobacteria bacterium]|nr:hypothetical protein [Gammaproteobacteria bacterium]